MEKLQSIFKKAGILNLLGAVAFFFTLYYGGAGVWFFLLSIILIIVFEYFYRFLNKGRFSPYLLMIFSPLLLIHYSSIVDFRIRVACFIFLIYIITAARTSADRKMNISLMKAKTPVVWLTAFVVFALASLLLYFQGIHLSGDEPHYIMITQSIVEDGDFDLKNNMTQENYFKYMPVEIQFHGGEYNGRYYSFHTPGVSFLLIPFYWLFGLLGGIIPPQLFFRLAAGIINAFFALGLFILLKKSFPGKNITLSWLFFTAVFPLVFHGIHLFPELPAAALMMYGYIFACTGKKNYLLAGLFLAFVPWFHVKYIPALVFLAAVIIFKLFKEKPAAPANAPGVRPVQRLFAAGRLKRLCCFFIFPIISFILLSIYTRSLYGSFNPAHIFPSEGYFTVPILARARTLAAYFFDQRDGLLFYAPLFFLAFFGLKRKFDDRGVLVWTAVIYILFHANTTLRGAYSPAGRPLMFVSWILVIVIVNFYYSIAAGQKSKYTFKLLTGLTIFISIWLFYYPLFVYQPVFAATTERASGLLSFLGSSYIKLTSFFPSFLSISNWNYAANYVWLGFLVLILAIYYFPLIKEPILRFLGKKEKMLSFFLFLVLSFLLCFYPHIHLLSQNKFSNKKISFFNNSKNFYYIAERDVFRIKAGSDYDIFFDLKKQGEGDVTFHFINTDQVDVKVRNGKKLLYRSQKSRGERFAFKMATLRQIRIKDKPVAHIGIETGNPVDKENPFLFLQIE